MISTIFSSDVIDLSPSNFDSLVLKSNLPFFVEFFAPWCGHCKQLAPTWEKAATGLKGVVPFGKVDCTAHQSLCETYQVKGYPTIKLFNKKGKSVLDYQQGRDARSIMDYAIQQLENNVDKVAASSEDKFWAKMDGHPHALLFSTKSDVTPLYKSMAIKYKSKIVFGQVKSTETELVSRYGLENFPALLVFEKKDDTSPQKFEGTISPEALEEFFGSIAAKVQGGEEADEQQKPKADAPPSTYRPTPKEVVLQHIESENVDSVCQNNYCILSIVDAEDDAIKEPQKTVIETVLAKFKKDDKLLFTWVDRSKSSSLTQKFSLQDTPSLVVYNSKRKRFLVADNYETDSIIKLIERVLTGDAVYKNL